MNRFTELTAKALCTGIQPNGMVNGEDTRLVTFGPDYADPANDAWAKATPSLSVTMVMRADIAERIDHRGKYDILIRPNEG